MKDHSKTSFSWINDPKTAFLQEIAKIFIRLKENSNIVASVIHEKNTDIINLDFLDGLWTKL